MERERLVSTSSLLKNINILSNLVCKRYHKQGFCAEMRLITKDLRSYLVFLVDEVLEGVGPGVQNLLCFRLVLVVSFLQRPEQRPT